MEKYAKLKDAIFNLCCIIGVALTVVVVVVVVIIIIIATSKLT